MWPFKESGIIPKDYNGIILEIGKRYNRRSGEVVQIISEAHSPYTFLDENSRCYWWNGRDYNGIGESEKDIIGDAIDWERMR